MAKPAHRALATAVALSLTALASVVGPVDAAGPDDRFAGVVQWGTAPGSQRVVDMARSGTTTYVVGYTLAPFDGFTQGGDADAYVAKVEADGDIAWVDQFGSPEDEDGAYAIVLDADGNVYVGGVTQAAPVEGYSDAYVRKYSPSGQLLWNDQFYGPTVTRANYVESVNDLAISGSTLYATGSVDDHGFLRQYSLTGAVTSMAEEPSNTFLYAVAAAANGDIYVTGSRLLDPEWWTLAGFVRRHVGASVTEVAVPVQAEPMPLEVTTDSVYVGGQSWGDEGMMSNVIRLDRNLATRWTSPIAHDALVLAVAVAADGDVFVSGASWTGRREDGFVRKLHGADGSGAWQFGLESSGWGIQALAVEGERVVFAAGSQSEMTTDGVGAFVTGIATTRTVPVTALAGADAIGTAIAISQEGFPGVADGVVLVSADSSADAVVSGPLAYGRGGPILLTRGATLDSRLRSEIGRLLNPGATITIVGGPAAVPTAIADAVLAMGYEVERLAGATRFDTAVAVAQSLGSPPAVIADGRAFADALVAGSVASQTFRAVLFTDGRSLPAVTRTYLAGAPSGHTAIGGAASWAAPGAESIAGPDRYATALAVADAYFAGAPVVGIASGASYPDALALSALLALDGAPLLLTPPDALHDEVAARLHLGMQEVYLAGGSKALAPDVTAELREMLTERP